MDVCKRVALRLHGLARDDQQWLMTNLEPTQCEKISRYLAELEDLGLTPESVGSIAGEFLREGIGGNADEIKKTPQEISALDNATLEEIRLVLATEPVEAKFFVLNIFPWSWTQPYIGTLDPSSRRVLEQFSLTGSKVKQNVRREALNYLNAKLVNARLSEGVLPVATTPSGGALGELTKRVRRMLCI